MAIPKILDDLSIIQKLSNLPNETDGLSADSLKAAFDEAPLKLQQYINEELVPYLEGDNAATGIGIAAIEGVNAGDVQRALEILKGQINDASTGAIPDNSIENAKLKNKTVSTEKIADSAVTTSIVADGAITDEKIVSISGNKVTGYIASVNIPDAAIGSDQIADFSINERKISAQSVTEPKIGISAVTAPKIADGAVSKDFALTLTADGWTGNEPCTQTVSVAGMLDTDEPVVDYTPSTDFETAVDESEAYGLVYDIVTGNGTVTAYAIDKPEIAINLRLKVVRK